MSYPWFYGDLIKGLNKTRGVKWCNAENSNEFRLESVCAVLIWGI